MSTIKLQKSRRVYTDEILCTMQYDKTDYLLRAEYIDLYSGGRTFDIFIYDLNRSIKRSFTRVNWPSEKGNPLSDVFLLINEAVKNNFNYILSPLFACRSTETESVEICRLLEAVNG